MAPAMAETPARTANALPVFQTAAEKHVGIMDAAAAAAAVTRAPIAPRALAYKVCATKHVVKDLSPPQEEDNATAMEPASSTTIVVKVSARPAQKKGHAAPLNAMEKNAETMDAKGFAEIARRATPAKTSPAFHACPNVMEKNVAVIIVAENVASVETGLSARTSPALSASPNAKTANAETMDAVVAAVNAIMNPSARVETAWHAHPNAMARNVAIMDAGEPAAIAWVRNNALGESASALSTPARESGSRDAVTETQMSGVQTGRSTTKTVLWKASNVVGSPSINTMAVKKQEMQNRRVSFHPFAPLSVLRNAQAKNVVTMHAEAFAVFAV